MPQEAGTIGITEFINQVQGSPNEYSSLLYLAATLQQRWAGVKSTGPESAAQAQIINLLKTRIAQLSHTSDRKMRQAAVNASQISKALEKKGTSADAARRFDPVLQLLQKQIEHSRQSVQVGIEAVKKLDALMPRPAGEGVAAEKKTAATKKAGAKKAAGGKKAVKVVTKGAGTTRKAAARKRGTQTKSAAGESKPATGG
jgi:hypothetical protein